MIKKKKSVCWSALTEEQQDLVVKEFIDWYIQDLMSVKEWGIPFYLKIDPSNPGDDILIVGKEAIDAHLSYNLSL
jgi:hypothetical protein